MIKRTKKFTSLLLAGASMMSLVPIAANAATNSKIDAEDGTIEKAIAYADGKYIYVGYKDEDDDNALYYSKGSGKDKTLEDLEDAELIRKYGDSKVVVEDDDDEYVVDLATGKVSDDEVSDLNDEAERALSRALKKADRYDDYSITTATTGAAVQLAEITPEKFADKVWYQYKAEKSGEDTLFGFTDDDGNYIDASYTANMYIYNGESSKKIKEFSESDTTKSETVILKNIKAVAQDKDYIYAIATVKVNGGKHLDGTAITGDQYYLQKISKKRSSDKEDGAYLPDSVTSYLISDKAEDSDMRSAYDKLITVASSGEVFLNDDIIDITFSGNDMYVISADDDTVTVTTYNLKNAKIEPKDKSSKVTVYGVFYDDNEDQDIESKDAVSVDVNGNVWALDKGKIYKSEKGKNFEKVYNCDGAFDSLDVYDEKNIVVWDSEGDSYGVLGGKSSVNSGTENGTGDTDNKENNQVTNSLKIGWNQNAAGVWNYSKDGKTIVSNSWIQDGGRWYYLGANGAMATGWINDHGTWYYLNPVSDGTKGAMKTGWVQDGGTWYYLQSNGAMKIGWLNDGGTWYYLQSNGAMAANTVVDGYRLGANGAWIK